MLNIFCGQLSASSTSLNLMKNLQENREGRASQNCYEISKTIRMILMENGDMSEKYNV